MRTYKRLLVSGSLGFIGSAFCHMYQEKYEIVGVDFAGWGALERNRAPGVADVRADIADAKRIRAIVDEIKPDAIINIAAESHVDRANDDDSSFWRSNVLGARNLALEASRLGIRIVQVSTDEVYGTSAPNAAPWIESSPAAPRNTYAVTKRAIEEFIRVCVESKKYRLDAVITRGANTIGPRQFPEKAIPKAVAAFMRVEPFPLFRTPARRMWMHVDDHVTGIDAALLHGQPGEIYNLAPSPMSERMTSEVIERVCSLVGASPDLIRPVEDRDNYDLRYFMSADKAKGCLGWQAQYDFDRALEATVKWYMSNPDWLREAQNKIVRLGG
jgi:dTDP-glucose 4,6-dehydratase